MIQRTHFVENGEGWALALKQSYCPKTLSAKRRPVAIIPGYGMNAFIFGYHPTGRSMEEYWAQIGFEVWSINLRAQGGSKRRGGRLSYGFSEVAVNDVRCAFDYIIKHSETKADRVDAVGCSLGGTYLFVHLACVRETNRLGSVVAIGAPLRWSDVHPALRLISSSPWLLGNIHLRGARQLARIGLPLLERVPKILNIYLHPDIVDTSKIGTLVQTIENPNPVLNRQIAEWIKAKDLFVDGINITHGLSAAQNPLLVVLSNADGIVPEAAALSARNVIGSRVKEVLRVGTDAVPVAHADLFISDYAQAWVFEPLGQWLIRQNAPLRKTRTTKKKPPTRATKGQKGGLL